MRLLKFVIPTVLVVNLSPVHAEQENCRLSSVSASWWVCRNGDPCPAYDPQFSVEANVTTMGGCVLVVHGKPNPMANGAMEFYEEVQVKKKLPPPRGTLTGCNDDLGYYASKPGSIRKMDCQGAGPPTPEPTTLIYGVDFFHCP